MNLFRSGERHEDGGATIPVTKLCDLAHAWWGDRLSPEWEPHTREQNQAIIDRLGLVGDFWRLP